MLLWFCSTGLYHTNSGRWTANKPKANLVASSNRALINLIKENIDQPCWTHLRRLCFQANTSLPPGNMALQLVYGLDHTFSEGGEGNSGWVRVEAFGEAMGLTPSWSQVEETTMAASLAAKARSSLFPHSTRYSPAMMNTAPIMLHESLKQNRET